MNTRGQHCTSIRTPHPLRESFHDNIHIYKITSEKQSLKYILANDQNLYTNDQSQLVEGVK